MTRFLNFGSIGKNLKRAIVLTAFVLGVSAEDAEYKVRIHKSLIQDTMNQNFPVVLEHIGKKKEWNQYLTGAMANVKELDVQIQPNDSDWGNLNTDLFFDQGQIVMEIHALEVVGTGIVVADSGSVERLKIRAPIDLCQLVITPEQEVNEEGILYPKFEISDVVFQTHADEFSVDVTGDLPLYKESRIEREMKKWLETEMKTFEKDFKVALQVSEKQIMNSFAFKQNLRYGGKLQAMLSETISLADDYMVIKYSTDYEAEDAQDKEFLEDKKKLRKVEHDFSDLSDYTKDVQVVLDENNINYQLLNMFHKAEPFSLTESLISVWPETFQGGAAFIKGLMSVAVWGTYFPALKAYPPTTQVDFRCSYNKEFLKEGGLQDNFISKVSFRDQNRIEGDMHVGCKIFAYDKPAQGFDMKFGQQDMNALMELIQLASIDKDDPNWKSTQSVYLSTKYVADFEFGEDSRDAVSPLDVLSTILGQNAMKDRVDELRKSAPFIYGRVVDFTPNVQELIILTDGSVDKSEGARLNDFIMNIKSKLDLPGVKMLTSFFNQGVPLVPFPVVQRCLGFQPKDSHMVIQEGYAVLAFDYGVAKSDTGCLFDMDNQIVKQEEFLLERERKRLGLNGGQDIDMTKFAEFAQRAAGKMQQMRLPTELLQNANLEQGFEGVKNAVKDLDMEKIKNTADKVKDGADKAYQFAKDNKHYLDQAKDMGSKFFNLF